jgi:hypothetical protein
MKKLLAAGTAGLISLLLVSCGGSGGGGDGSSQQSIDPGGLYANVVASGGPGFTIIDQPAPGVPFVVNDPSMFVAPDGTDRVMALTLASGLVFVAKVSATVDPVAGFGTISGTGTAYAPTVIRGARVRMIFANGKTAAPASVTSQYTSGKNLLNGSIVIQGDEDKPIKINGAEFNGPALVGTTTTAQLVGNYQEADIQNVPARPLGTFTVDGNSLVAGTDVFGSFTGRVTFRDTTQILQKIELTYTPTGGTARNMAGYLLTGARNLDGTVKGFGTIAVGGDSLFDYGWFHQ